MTDRIDQVLLAVRRHCEAHAGRLSPDELERLADVLLRIAGDDPAYPSRCDLEHHTRDIHSLDDPRDPVARRARTYAAPATGPSLQALIARLLVAANLGSRGQRRVARLYLMGHSTGEIARALDLPRTTVQSRWRRARPRLQDAVRDLPLSEWLALPSASERISPEAARLTFGAEQRRTRYRPPHHCPEGRERCGTTGVCPCRTPPD